MPTSISEPSRRLVCLGVGQVARTLARRLIPMGVAVAGTTRDPAKASAMSAAGIEPIPWPVTALPAGPETALLVSIAPDEMGDAGLDRARALIDPARPPGWIGYLSATSVYGDRDGQWVDEASEPLPSSARGRRRLEAEHAWAAFGRQLGSPTHLFRLAGIYGPESNALLTVRAGSAQRVVKPGLAFSRIHVDDIAATLAASMAKPRDGAVYNLADDEPAPPDAVIDFACTLLGVEPPPPVPFEQAQLSPMGRSFYLENKRVANRLIKTELGVKLRYPTYREGLSALL